MVPRSEWDAVVVGGGFFGASLALLLAGRGLSVLLVEREDDLMQRASFHNQARIHAGYHYPRSLLTAVRSRVSFPRFVEDFAGCVVDDFECYYAVSRLLSKVTAEQFRVFMQRIGASLSPASARVRRLFDSGTIEAVFTAREAAFDAERLRAMMRERLDRAGVALRFKTDFEHAVPVDGGWELRSAAGEPWRARWIFNCTYCRLNRLRLAARMPALPLKHELAELVLVQPPPELAGIAITVMCGPFFSLMPFPPRGLWTLSHVRYTPHRTWSDDRASPSPGISHAPMMIRDAARYVPALSHCDVRGSLWEVKTILPQHEIDDGRPILFHHDPRWPGFVSVMGGKLDNVYDLAGELDKLDLAKPG